MCHTFLNLQFLFLIDCSFEETPMEMDREFLQDLRELKQILDRESFDELKTFVLSAMKKKLPDRVYSDLESNFKVTLRFYHYFLL